MTRPWLSPSDMPLGDHRDLVREVRDESGHRTALAYWTGSFWAFSPVSEKPLAVDFVIHAQRAPLPMSPAIPCSCGLSWSAEGLQPRETILCTCGGGVVVPELSEDRGAEVPRPELHMIAWASGMIEFVRELPEPDGAIHCCTAYGNDAIRTLLEVIREQSILHCFTDAVALRVPGITPALPSVLFGFDLAVEVLMRWEDDVREVLGQHPAIDWMRA